MKEYYFTTIQKNKVHLTNIDEKDGSVVCNYADENGIKKEGVHFSAKNFVEIFVHPELIYGIELIPAMSKNGETTFFADVYMVKKSSPIKSRFNV